MAFEIKSPARIVIKQGAVRELENYLKGMGERFVILTDPFLYNSPLTKSIQDQIKDFGAEVLEVGVAPGEPTVDNVDKTFYSLEDFRPDVVVGIGGGSTLDTAKCISVLLTNGAPCIDYLEYVGKGKKILADPVPFVAIPTTSGTGTEAGNVSVLCSHELNFKRSMRDPRMIPRIAIVDAELTVSCPPKVTAQSGLDALAHNIESYSSWRSTPASEMYALKGIEFGGKYMRRAYENPDDLEAREGMCICSVMGGLALMNAGVGAAHGIGMAIGIEFGLGHGEAVGIAMPHVMRLNAEKIPERMCRIGEALTGRHFDSEGEGARAAVEFMTELNAALNVEPDFKYLGIEEDRMEYFANAIQGNSLNGNPVKLEIPEWAEFLKTIL